MCNFIKINNYIFTNESLILVKKHSKARQSNLVSVVLVSKSKFVTNLISKSIYQDATVAPKTERKSVNPESRSEVFR